jgi:hypothetical protein
MHKVLPFVLCVTLSVVFNVYSQLTEFIDDFERGSPDTTWSGSSHTLWSTGHSQTYELNFHNGIMDIGYTRTSQSGPDDTFRFLPPDEIDIYANPRIKIDIKADVPLVLTMRTIHFLIPQIRTEAVAYISGDDTWRTYTFDLDISETLGLSLLRIQFYFDRGTTQLKSGMVQFDNFKIAGSIINVTELEASVTQSNRVDLRWSTDNSAATDYYKIYRGIQSGFLVDHASLIGSTSETSYQDTELANLSTYYYRIAAIDLTGEEHVAKNEIRQQTYTPGVFPAVAVTGVNTDSAKKYEKLEIMLELNEVAIENPYDPDDIDVFAHFISPDKDTIRVNAFYDDYQSADQWKIRFSPRTTGSWEYTVYVNDVGGSGASPVHTFTAIESDHRGPLRISSHNPNYLIHDDGTTFYGQAVYYPWFVSENGLNRLRNADVNIFGYWNSTFEGQGNGGGRFLIESMESGVGRYDQRKVARIDQILQWAEDRDLKVMLAIWAHPFLRVGGQPWPDGRWDVSNPYSRIVEAAEFYTDSLSWSYQEKQYRYIVARWGYSRALGIWEIINEIHGTTGFILNRNGAIEWTNKVHDILKEQDPFGRPTTASYGSVNIWSLEDIRVDMPNRHYYETGGEYSRPYGDNVRDGLFNIVNVYRGLKGAGDRPAILGEAGYTSMFSDVSSLEYTEEFHNAFWSGVMNGMSTTPFWWEFNSTSIFTNARMETYRRVKNFVSDIHFANQHFVPADVLVDNSDAYGMRSDSAAFGWFRNYADGTVSGSNVIFRGLSTGSYATLWYNTWTADTVGLETSASVYDRLPLTVPELTIPRKDIAFKIQKIENGTAPVRLHIFSEKETFGVPSDSGYIVVAYIADGEHRLIDGADNEITFSLAGPGLLSAERVQAVDGIAEVTYYPSGSGSVSITASADGLESATLNKVITGIAEGDPFTLPDEFALRENYPNPFNPATTIRYELPVASRVSLKIFDILGREVAVLVDDYMSAGIYDVQFDASSLPSGLYIYRLETEGFNGNRRMMFVK